MAAAAPKPVEMPSGLPGPRPSVGAGRPKAQALARTSFGGEKDPFYDSSDDEGTTESGFAGLDGLSPAPSTGQKFKVRSSRLLVAFDMGQSHSVTHVNSH